MRRAAIVLIGVMLGVTSGCSLWKPAVPAPTKEQFVLHGIVDFNKSTIRPGSIPLLQEAATMLNARGNLGVVVEGYSDSKGSTEHNAKLSLRRAETVRNYLVTLGVDKNRIAVIGKGASEPIATNDTREGRAKNRRVAIVVYQP
jgi:OOP family OmpA-OmpF porin